MSATRRRLEQALRTEGAGFAFAQAVRLLHRLYPTRAPIGGWADPGTEVVRLGVPPSLAFPPAEVAEVELPKANAAGEPVAPARLQARFFGLVGPQGVLPHVYTEHALARSRAKDTAFRAFLDLFHHRLLSLFYRAWERYRPMLAGERGEEDRLRSHLLDLVGAGTPAVQGCSPVPPDVLAHYAGLLASRTRSALGLVQLVMDYFRVPADSEQFVGEWRPLTGGGQLCIGDEGLDGTLGAAVVGSAIYDPHAAIRLRLGPLPLTQFQAFLPGGRDHAMLLKLVGSYVEDRAQVRVRLVLRRTDVTQTVLGVPGAPALSFGTWLGGRPRSHDPDDVEFAL